MVFGLSSLSDDIAEIRSDQGKRPDVASGSRKLGTLFWHHGRMIQATVVPQFGKYQPQIAG